MKPEFDQHGHHARQETGGAGRPEKSSGHGGQGEAGRTALVEAEG